MAAHGLPLVFNPEFLREGCAVDDFLAPGLIVLGGDDARAMGRVAELYTCLLYTSHERDEIGRAHV